MESDNKKNKLAIIFQEFMHLNQEQIGYFQSTRDYLVSLEDSNRIDSSELLEKNSVNGISYSVFNSKDSKKLKAIYSRLDVDAPIVIEILDEFVEFLKDEENKLKELFINLDFEEISTLKQFNEASIRYNEKENLFLKKLQIKAPEILDLESQVFGIEENILEKNNDIFKESAKNFVNFYAEVYRLIQNKSDKESVFNALVSTLKYLEQYVKPGNTINQDFAEKFIKAVNQEVSGYNRKVKELKKRSLINVDGVKFKNGLSHFLRNFFNAKAALGMSIISNMNEFLKELGYEDGRIEKTYKSANEDNKLDKFLKNAIEQLFNGVEFNVDENNEIELKELVLAITKVGDTMKELKDRWEVLKTKLHEGIINSRFDFVNNKSFNDLEFNSEELNESSNKISIKYFENLFKNNEKKNEVKFIINYLKIIINRSEKSKFWEGKGFKSFLKQNEKEGIIESLGYNNDDGEFDKNIFETFKKGLNGIGVEYNSESKEISLKDNFFIDSEITLDIKSFLLEIIGVKNNISDGNCDKFTEFLNAYKINDKDKEIKTFLDFVKKNYDNISANKNNFLEFLNLLNNIISLELN